MTIDISVVIPAKNEAASLGALIDQIRSQDAVREVIVVDDGSTDGTGELAARCGARVIRHDVSKGNGAAIKSGARAADNDWILFMDADGQHRPEDIPALTCQANNADLIVGARSISGQASVWRWGANAFYNWFSSLVSGQKIDDLTSGFRLVRREYFLKFLHLLPNGFSYPTTSTMAFLRSGYSVKFVSITVLKRVGKSHIKPLRDGVRFLIIIFKIATLYSPMKVFLPVAVVHFLLGLCRYAYTYFNDHVFTNMSALLMVAGIQIFLIGLISEQIATLIYKDSERV